MIGESVAKIMMNDRSKTSYNRYAAILLVTAPRHLRNNASNQE